MTKKAEKTEKPVPAEVSPEALGAELTEKAVAGAEVKSSADKPEAAAPVAFDLSKLTPDQLGNLKAALDSVPDASHKAVKKNATVELRTKDGKVIVDFGRAYKKLVMDLDSRTEKERQHINVRFHGEAEDVVMNYQEFMSLDRVTCEVVKVVTHDREKQVGECYKKEIKRMVPMMVNWQERVFTIKLPNGDLLDIDAAKVNP